MMDPILNIKITSSLKLDDKFEIVFRPPEEYLGGEPLAWDPKSLLLAGRADFAGLLDGKWEHCIISKDKLITQGDMQYLTITTIKSIRYEIQQMFLKTVTQRLFQSKELMAVGRMEALGKHTNAPYQLVI